jgi:hypothetical protein
MKLWGYAELPMLYGLDGPSEVEPTHLISRMPRWIVICLFLPAITTKPPTSQQAYPYAFKNYWYHLQHACMLTLFVSTSRSAPVNSLSIIAAAGCSLLLNKTRAQSQSPFIYLYFHISKNIILHSPPSFLCITRSRCRTFFVFICSFLCLTDLTWGLGGHNHKQQNTIRKQGNTTREVSRPPLLKQIKNFNPNQ